ncbi:MAG TPA: 4-hydroxythreonine-4-phosphate dehydrogenase PdxA [Burkholderiales bacterium]|nr:4-hydroxythreonine-4-phosphate dehydrogenase PdxA [Burkholderiales bacterium]
MSLKAALDPKVRALCNPVVIGSGAAIKAHAQACGLPLRNVEVLELGPGEFTIGEIHAAHGRAAIAAAQRAIRGAAAGDYGAVVAAPHSETAIHAAGIEFDGYASFVARTLGLPPEEAILMLCFEYAGREVRIAHVTLHTSVSAALKLITQERVLRTIRAVDDALKRLGYRRPRIGVSGLNPHAGEGGLFGDEEQKVIAPAVEQARSENVSVDGPIGADILIQRAGYDAYVVMLHDQGHIPAKVLAPNGAAALTIGTPVLFSSVAHGAAFDIAGRNLADPAAMVEAITRLVSHRRRAPQTR